MSGTVKHGMIGTPVYNSWSNMNQRINNPRHHKYPLYGGRGIDMDPRWRDFHTFLADMGCPSPLNTIGRIDNNRGYWPDNCRWETPKQQCNNTRCNVLVAAFGRTQTVTQWTEELNLHSRFRYRIAAGWEPEKAISTPYRGDNSRSLNIHKLLSVKCCDSISRLTEIECRCGWRERFESNRRAREAYRDHKAKGMKV